MSDEIWHKLTKRIEIAECDPQWVSNTYVMDPDGFPVPINSAMLKHYREQKRGGRSMGVGLIPGKENRSMEMTPELLDEALQKATIPPDEVAKWWRNVVIELLKRIQTAYAANLVIEKERRDRSMIDETAIKQFIATRGKHEGDHIFCCSTGRCLKCEEAYVIAEGILDQSVFGE